VNRLIFICVALVFFRLSLTNRINECKTDEWKTFSWCWVLDVVCGTDTRRLNFHSQVRWNIISSFSNSIVFWGSYILSAPCFERHVKPLAPAAFAVVSTHQSARVLGYDPFCLSVIHKEGLCPSRRDNNRLMMMMMMTLWVAIQSQIQCSIKEYGCAKVSMILLRLSTILVWDNIKVWFCLFFV
jgi:hypothetical protein